MLQSSGSQGVGHARASELTDRLSHVRTGMRETACGSASCWTLMVRALPPRLRAQHLPHLDVGFPAQGARQGWDGDRLHTVQAQGAAPKVPGQRRPQEQAQRKLAPGTVWSRDALEGQPPSPPLRPVNVCSVDEWMRQLQGLQGQVQFQTHAQSPGHHS